ncbi:MAG TPA: hypothetical protein VFR15_14085 [Chloroflexia bacterium]|nr:hypothetical protein [Chloroflexia bacterium]
MIERRPGIRRELWLAGILAGVLAMALALGGVHVALAALIGFLAGLVLYFALLLGNARKP